MRGQKVLALLLGLLAIVFSAAAPSQPFPPNTTVDSLFEQWDKTTSPGCSLAVAKAGRIIYSRGYGMADLDHGITNTPTTVFHAASLAKQFTAMSIMLLDRQKLITLDDDIHDYIGELVKSRSSRSRSGRCFITPAGFETSGPW